MTIDYPYSSPIILTDAIYTTFGGHVGDSNPAQRQASYLIAEKQMTSHLSSFLLPTTVTGTFSWPKGSHLALPYGRVTAIKNVTVYSQENCYDCDLEDFSGCAFVYDDLYGYIDVRQVESYCCYGCFQNPYQVRVAWESGLSSGTSYQPDMLLALTMAAEITLNEIIDPAANEGTGDIGIQNFTNQEYKEERVKLGRNSFGTSARAQKIAQLVSNLRKKRALKF